MRNSIVNSRPQFRDALSLVELLVVVTMLGLFASAAMMRFGRDTFADSGARSESRLLSLTLLHAQRSAIRTGEMHGVVFQGGAASSMRWQVMKRDARGGLTAVDEEHDVAQGVSLTTDRHEIWFDFEGIGIVPFNARLAGVNRTYDVRVEPLTRMITTEEVGR